MRWISCLLIGILCASAGEAWGESCLVTTTQANFGIYDSIGSVPSDAIAVISINCSAGIAYNIKFDPGQNAQAGFQRRMRSSWGTTLNYNLYIDPALTEIWGDGSGSTFTLSGTGGPGQYSAYGRIPGGQKARAGIYNDAIIVTVEW